MENTIPNRGAPWLESAEGLILAGSIKGIHCDLNAQWVDV